MLENNKSLRLMENEIIYETHVRRAVTLNETLFRCRMFFSHTEKVWGRVTRSTSLPSFPVPVRHCDRVFIVLYFSLGTRRF